MARTVRIAGAALAVMAAAAAPALADPVAMQATLAGAAEVPGPGAPKGSGSASLTLDAGANQLCYVLRSAGTDTPTMAHIHKGAAGVAGPVVVPLTAPASGTAQACTTVAPDVAAALLAAPSDFYVNVHTAQFPKGAMRGQLARK